MKRHTVRWVWVGALLLEIATPGLVHAQAPASSANPALSPYANPFLYQYMMQAPSGPQTTLMTMLAAQQMTGLGSGQLSGVRPRPSARETAAREPVSSARGVPAGRAGHYFNRSYGDAGAMSRYYGRKDSYFPRSR